MKSEIIDRILSENNESLHKMIEIVRNNAVFQDVMSNIKEEFFINESIHGISHNERVALLACYIGIQEGLDIEELKLVLEAAKYHDIGRGYEGNHGKYSTIIIDRNKEYIFPDLNDNEINIIKALCHGHSVDDSRYEEIVRLYGIKDIEQFKKLLNIVKDADALDRVRLPRFGKLDEKYLRTETAHGTIELAENLYREYRNIQKKIPSEDKITESKYTFNAELRDQLLFDGENYYLLRSLNKTDIDNLNSGNGIIPKIDDLETHTVHDVMAQIRMQHRKTNLISMSEDPNIVLTYDKSNLHRFVLIRISKEEIENSKKVFSAGEYLLGVIDSEIERIEKNAPEKVREILENVDRATSIDEIVRIINGADRQVPTSLVEVEQQYLSNLEQLNQSKKIAKCKVLNYYGLMRGIAHDERGKLLDISEFTRIMRNGYSSSEWLYSGKISQDKIINIPQILIDSLALLKQAEFQGKDKELLRKIEQEVLRLTISGEEINQDNYMLEYSAHNDLKNDLTIDRAYEITNGQISYRDTNMQQIAIRSLAEMTLNKRKIIELLKEKLPNIDIEELLVGTYCINQEMVTKQNNRGNQIGRNINFLISEYGYDFNEETSRQILESVENLTDEQLNSIVAQGINAQEISRLLIKTREMSERVGFTKEKKKNAKYIVEAIIEGYNWKKEGNSLTKSEKELMMNKLLRDYGTNNEIYKLYEAINKIQIGNSKFTQNQIFAIMINLAIDGKIGEISYRDLLKKDLEEIQLILLNNKQELQTSVLPISMDLLVGRGREIDKLKKELIDLGIDKEFIDSKDIKNIYVAKQIIEGYDFERELTDIEKKSLIKAILNRSNLNKFKGEYLSTLIKKLSVLGFEEQEIYGIIINLGINESIVEAPGAGYGNLISNKENAFDILAKYKEKIETTVKEESIQKAVSNNLNATEARNLRNELQDLGISKDFLDIKDSKNIYIAKKIVEEYDFGRELIEREKRVILQELLALVTLDISSTLYLYTLIENIEKLGYSQQETYGIIINLGLGKNIVEGIGYGYNDLLSNKNNVFEILALYKNDAKTTVSEIDIIINLSKNLNDEEAIKVKEQLENLGISKEFINQKDVKNLYMALEIVNGYDFRRKITNEEKRAIITSILDNKKLNNETNAYYLSSLVDNLMSIGLNIQEVYGTIINLGLNKSATEETEFSYGALLGSKKLCEEMKKVKIKTEVSELDIKIATIRNMKPEDVKKIRNELDDLGIDKEFIEKKDIKNLRMALEIVDGYDFGRKLKKEEKRAILQLVLNQQVLNKKEGIYLYDLIKVLNQMGLTEQEIYGAIINLGVNQKIIEQTGYGFSDLLSNKNHSCVTLENYKESIESKVNEETIQKALHLNLNEDKISQIKECLENLGISREFIEKKDDRNIYAAFEIVNGYNFGRELKESEKHALIKMLLDNVCLNKENHSYIYDLKNKFASMGLDNQQINGAIINLAVNQNIVNESGFGYKALLMNVGDARQNIEKHKGEMETQVSEITIKKALSENLNSKEIENLQKELEEIGISKEEAETIDQRNLYIALEMVKNYDFGRELKKEEKYAIIRQILFSKSFFSNKKPVYMLSSLLRNLQSIGFNEQETYGVAINLIVNNRLLGNKRYTYTELIKGRRTGIFEELVENKNEIETYVSEQTISQAILKANNPPRIRAKDIAAVAMELTAQGSGGSKICDDVQADYMRLLDEKTNNNQKEGSEQGDEN